VSYCTTDLIDLIDLADIYENKGWCQFGKLRRVRMWLMAHGQCVTLFPLLMCLATVNAHIRRFTKIIRASAR
jgi:hypothetical protein